MSAIIKIKPVHVRYLMGEDDINLNLLRVPQIYKLEKRSLTIVEIEEWNGGYSVQDQRCNKCYKDTM